MKKIILVYIFIFPIFSCKIQEKADFAIQNVTVIDVADEVSKSGMTVLITGTRISQVDNTHNIKLSEDVKIIDGSGKFLIPGLWDMHTHPYVEDNPTNLIGKRFMSIYIVNGITSVRVMLGSSIQQGLREEINAGKLIGPRMIIASPLASGSAPGRSDTSGVSNPEKGRQFVQKAYRTGADFVKLGSYIPRNVYFAIANEAKKQGIPFAGHLPYSIRGIEASDTGQLTLEHQFSILIPCSFKEDEIAANLMDALPTYRNRLKIYANIDYNEQKANQFFTHLFDNGTYVCPTIVVWDEFASTDKDQLFSDPRFNLMPSDIRERWKLSYENFADEEVKADMRRMNSKTHHIISEMNKVGIKILAGTDAGIPYVFEGFSLHKELELLVKCGLTPMEALQTATINAAECVGKLDSLGTIEEGKIADLILLDANPLLSIENTKRINSVFYNGKCINRVALDKILDNIDKLVHKE